MEDIVNYDYKFKKGERTVFPAHPMVKNWAFPESDESEAILCHYIAAVAEKNGLNQNDLQHLFPAILRMLRSDVTWAGQKPV